MAKKRLIVAAVSVVAVLAVGYPAAAWYLGTQIEKAHADARALIAAQPYLKVSNQSYERGLLSASETTTIEIPAALFSPPGVKADEKQNTRSPFRFTIKTAIQHGPLPGFSTLAAGSEVSTIEFDEPLRTKIAEAFGTNQPFDIRTTYNFQGGGRSTFASRPFKLVLPGNTPESKAMLSGEQMDMVMEFSRGLADYTLHGTAPRFALSEPGGPNLAINGMAFDSQLKRIFPDEPMLYSGSQKFTAAEISVTPVDGAQSGPEKNVLLKEIAYDVQMPVADDFVDVIAKMGANVVQVGEQNYGPAHYDFSLKHLHARKLSALTRALQGIYTNPEMLSEPNRLMKELSPTFFDLLEDNPVFSIDRIAFRTADGEANFKASIKLADPKPDDFSNPLMLLAKLDAGATIALPTALVDSLIGAGKSEEEALWARKSAEKTLEQFKQQGYITVENNLLKSSVTFKSGQLQVNGKPFNPMAAMLQHQSSQEPAEAEVEAENAAPHN